MLIDDLAGRNVRLSARSLTAVTDSGKTCGVVRNAVPLRSLPPRDLFTFASRSIREWEAKHRTYIRPEALRVVGGCLYYLRDMGWEERCRAVGDPGLTASADRMAQAAEEAAAIATVVPVYVVR